MTRPVSILASLILFSGHDLAAQPGGGRPPRAGTDEPEIHRIVLDSLFTGRATTAHLVADSTLADARTTADDAWMMQRLRPDFPRGAVQDFLEKQRLRPQPVAMIAAGRLPVHRLGLRAFSEIMSGPSGWAVITRRFGGPDAMVSFSRVGYDPERRWAMVGVRASRHPHPWGTDGTVMHSESLVLLRRGADGRWALYWWRVTDT